MSYVLEGSKFFKAISQCTDAYRKSNVKEKYDMLGDQNNQKGLNVLIAK